MSLFLVSFQIATGQNISNTSLKGTIEDSDGKPIEYVTIALMKEGETAPFQGTLSNDSGRYEFKNIKPGRYFTKVTSVGFNPTQSAVFEVSNGPNTVLLPVLTMQKNSVALKTVTVVATAPVIERRPDRLVVNVANSALAAGNSALEIISKAPGVSLDRNDAISLNGKSGVTVMINDKLTYLSSGQLTDLLRSTDGNSIQSLEIMTNPSAKYDAAGNSGIINIKLKKNSRNGFNGSLVGGVSVGRFFGDNTSLALNNNFGKFHFFGTINHRDLKRYEDITIERSVNGPNSSTYLQQHLYQTPKNASNSFRTGLDYEISSSNTLGFIINGIYNLSHNITDNTTNVGQSRQIIDSLQRTHSQYNNDFTNLAFNLNDVYKLDSAGQQLNIDLDHSKFDYHQTSLFSTSYFLPNGPQDRPSTFLTQRSPTTISIRTAKADYVLPFKNGVKFESGVKLSRVKTDNEVVAQGSKDGLTFTDNPALSNNFGYLEKISAGYINLSKNFKSTTLQVGLRSEYTTSAGNFAENTASLDRKYLDLFPSVFINHSINESNQLGINFSRRIDRPGYDQLNPFVYYIDQFTSQTGNPNLKAQYTNNFELNYSYQKNINITLGYAHTSGVITPVFLTDNIMRTSLYTTLNLHALENYSLNFNFPYTIAKWWTGEGSGTAFYLRSSSGVISGVNYNYAKAAYKLKASQILQVSKNFKFEVLTSYESATLNGLYTESHVFYSDAGVSHSLADKKLNIKFAVSDIFHSRGNTTTSNVQNTSFQFKQARDTRLARLTLTYNFGNSNSTHSEHKTGADVEKNRVRGAN